MIIAGGDVSRSYKESCVQSMNVHTYAHSNRYSNIEIVYCSSASLISNGIAPNNVGAGRTLGHAFDSLGGLFEDLANKLAHRLNLGPRNKAIALKQLRRPRRREDCGLESGEGDTKNESYIS